MPKTMEMFKLMWTAFYMPGHEESYWGDLDIREHHGSMSAMQHWITSR